MLTTKLKYRLSQLLILTCLLQSGTAACAVDADSASLAALSEKLAKRQEYVGENLANLNKEVERSKKVEGTKDEIIARLIHPLSVTYKPSQAFVEQVRAGLNYFPRSILAILTTHKYKILLVDKAIDAKPRLPQIPHGKSKASRYEGLAGFHNAWRHKIVIGAFVSLDGHFVPNEDIQLTTRHEVGHALNSLLYYPAWTKQFSQARQQDEDKMKASSIKSDIYYRQKGYRGSGEIFAELVASHYFEPDTYKLGAIEDNFQNCYKLVEAILPEPEPAVVQLSQLVVEREKLVKSKDNEQALKLQIEAVALSSSVDRSGKRSAVMSEKMAKMQFLVFDIPGMEDSYKSCIAFLSKLAPFQNTLIFEAQIELAKNYLQFGRWKEAQALCAEAEKIVGVLNAEDNVFGIDLKLTQSIALKQQGDLDAAFAAAEKALTAAQKNNDYDFLVSMANFRLAQLQFLRGDKSSAADSYRALVIAGESAKWTSVLAAAKTRLAEIELENGNLVESLSLVEEAMKPYSTEYKAKSPYLLVDTIIFARILTAQKRFDEAEKQLQNAIALSEKVGYSYDINRIKAWQAYANLLRLTDREAKAQELDGKALAMQKAYDAE